MLLGVCWCALSVTPEIENLLARARQSDRALSASLAEPKNPVLARELAAEGLEPALELASDVRVSDEEFAERIFALCGRPWSQAPARRDARERIRIWRRLTAGERRVPATLCDLFALWDAATAGEVPFYEESETVRLRAGTPFSQGGKPFEQSKPPAGWETVDPADIERELGHFFALIAREDLALEVRAAAALFALWHIHPFRDGNGHVGRMLLCDMLAPSYSVPTLLAFVSKLQGARGPISETMAEIVREHKDLAPFVELVLSLLAEASQSCITSVQ